PKHKPCTPYVTRSLHVALPIYATATSRSKSSGAWASRCAPCASDVDQTRETRFPGNGSRAITPAATNHWRAIASCGASVAEIATDRKSTRLNSSHVKISYDVLC